MSSLTPHIRAHLAKWRVGQKAWHLVLFGFAIGAVSWTGHLWTFVAVLLVPLILHLTDTQIHHKISSLAPRIRTRLSKWRVALKPWHLVLFGIAIGAVTRSGHLWIFPAVLFLPLMLLLSRTQLPRTVSSFTPRLKGHLAKWPVGNRAWHIVFFGIAIGAVSWSGHLWTLPAVFLLPLTLHLASTRTPRNAIALAFGYFAGAMWPMIPGAALFFGTKNFPTEAVLLWIAYALLQTLPYLLIVWRPKGWAVGLTLATVVSVLSPIAILNPLTVAGVCFPGWGVVGILAVAALFATIPVHPRTSIGVLVVASVIAIVLYRPAPLPLAWTGSNTEYGGSSFAMNGTAEYVKAAAIRDGMLSSNDAVRIYPETTLVHWNSATTGFFRQLSKKLETHNQTVILGAAITHRGGVGYDNALIVFGADKGIYLQHLPMPYSMWNPRTPDSVPLRLDGPYTMAIHGLRAAPVICYEQLHPYPFLRSSFEHPQIIVAVANDYWAKTTYIRYVQHSAVSAWARLFNIPFVSATNQ